MQVQRPNTKQLVGFALGSLLAVAVAACAPQVDLQAVQDYAKATADASASFSAVAQGWAQSCSRTNELTLQPSKWTDASLSQVPPFFAAPVPTPSPGPITPEHCDVQLAQAVSADWDRHNQIVLGYVQALGALAGVDAQPSFAPLGNALVQASLINSTQNTAFTDLANRITTLIISGEQRQDIAGFLTSVNGPLKTAITALQQVDSDYTGVLSAEFVATNTYYSHLIAAECQRSLKLRNATCPAKANVTPQLRDRVWRIRARMDGQLTAINADITAANNYSKVLSDIQATHEKLYEAAQRKLNMQDYAIILQQDVVPLYQDVEQLKG